MVCFPGPGSQHAGMARGLRREPVFRRALADCDAIARPLLGRSLLELVDGVDPQALTSIEVNQPVVSSEGLVGRVVLVRLSHPGSARNSSPFRPPPVTTRWSAKSSQNAPNSVAKAISATSETIGTTTETTKISP